MGVARPRQDKTRMKNEKPKDTYLAPSSTLWWIFVFFLSFFFFFRFLMYSYRGKLFGQLLLSLQPPLLRA